MKSFYLLLFAFMLSFAATAQNMTRFEYFIDTDPGVGLATAANPAASPTVTDFNIAIATSSLTTGFHTLYLRGMNTANEWTHTHFRNFYIVPLNVPLNPDITQIEYFVDTDLGVGLNTPLVNVTPSQTITNHPIPIDAASLSPGFHTLYVRSKNSAGEWTHTHFRNFYVANISTADNLVKFEYFFDTDPGFEAPGTIAAPVTPPAPSVTNQDIFAIPSSLSVGTHTIYIRAKDSSGDWTQVITAPFNVTAAPPPTILSFSPASGSVGTTVTITGTDFDATLANNVIKFNGVVTTPLSGTPTSLTTTVPIGATDGKITVTVLSNTATSANDFIVTACPAAPGVSDSSGCLGTDITLTASGAPPGQYRWYNVPFGGTPISSEVNSSYTAIALTTTSSFYVSINDGNCESPRSEVVASIVELPPPPSIVQPNPVCYGSSVMLSASGGTNGQYRWYDGANLIAGQTNSSYTIANLTSIKKYLVSIFDGTCESTKTSITATVQDCSPPVISTSTSTAFLEGIVAIDLQALVSDPENNLDASTLQLIGSLTSGAQSTLDGFILTINYAGVPFPGTDEITIKICDLTGLCSTQILTIELGGDITVFNALSPNGDSKNEIFRIQYIDILPETQNNKVTIFNRWGDVVFETENYDNINKVFRGVNKNGNELPTGTYFYKIAFESNGKTKTGFISLRR